MTTQVMIYNKISQKCLIWLLFDITVLNICADYIIKLDNILTYTNGSFAAMFWMEI